MNWRLTSEELFKAYRILPTEVIHIRTELMDDCRQVMERILANLYHSDDHTIVFPSRTSNYRKIDRRYLDWFPRAPLVKLCRDHLLAHHFIEVQPAFKDHQTGIGRCMRIAAQGWMLDQLHRRVKYHGIHQIPWKDPILLKHPDHKYLIPYQDTPFTENQRILLTETNHLLNRADISVISSGINSSPGSFTSITGKNFSLNEYAHLRRGKIQLYQVFLGDFGSYGRIHGGAWQAWSADKRATMKIFGEPVAGGDFPSCFVRIVYASLGHYLPTTWDAYDYGPAWNSKYTRDQRKDMFQCAVSSKSPSAAIRAIRWLPAIQDLKAFEDAKPLYETILASHKPISEVFHKKAWLWVINLEAKICSLVLRQMVNQDEVVLPVHDGFYVRQSVQSKLHEAMERAWEIVIPGSIAPKIAT